MRSGIICWACLTLAISVLQFDLLQWRSEFNKNQEKNESQQNQDLCWISLRGCHRSCRLQLHQARWREGTEIKILGNLLLQMIDQGNLTDSPPAGYSKLDYDRFLVFSRVEKWGYGTHDRSGKPDKTSWNTVQQVRPHHGDTLLDGDAQSVRYGGMLHDRSGQPDSANSQEVADSETFRHGKWRSRICEQSKRSSAKKTEKNVERCKLRRRTFNNLVNVYGCDDECGDIHGKEFPG